MDLFPPEQIVQLLKTREKESFDKALELLIDSKTEEEIVQLKANLKMKYIRQSIHIKKMWDCVNKPTI